MGRLKGDTIECSYHGLVYNRSGTCIKVPGQNDVPRSAQLKRYPVADVYGYSWIWMGDPARADTHTIPDYGRLSLPGLGRHRIALHVEGNYQLIVDNLLDLSHLPCPRHDHRQPASLGEREREDRAARQYGAGQALGGECRASADFRPIRWLLR